MRARARQCWAFVAEAGGVSVAVVLPLLFNPWQRAAFEPAKVTALLAIVVAMSALSLICAFKSGRAGKAVPLSRHPLFWPVTALVIAHVSATVASDAPTHSLWGKLHNPQGLLTTLGLAALFLLLARGLVSEGQLHRIVTALIFGSIPVTIYGLAQFVGLDPLPWITDSVSPVFSTLGRSNFLGAYLAMIIPLTLSRIVSGAGRRYTVVLMLQVTCLWLTLARAAWLGFVIGTLLFAGSLARRWRNAVLSWLFVLVTLFGSALYVAMDTTALRRPASAEGSSPPPGELRQASIHARLIIWQTTLGLIGQRWLLGYGPDQFQTVFAANYPPDLARFERPQVIVDDPHNMVLGQLMTAGVVGLATLLGIYINFYRIMLKVLRHCRNLSEASTPAAFIASLTAFLVQAQFVPNVIVPLALAWLVLALGTGQHMLSMVERQAGEAQG